MEPLCERKGRRLMRQDAKGRDGVEMRGVGQ